MTPEQFNSRFDFSISPTELGRHGDNIHLLLSASLRSSHTFRLYAEILATAASNAVFLPFEVGATDEERLAFLVKEFQRNTALQTIMVSHPFKRRIRHYLDQTTERASRARAVNLITKSDGRTIGDNLDGVAFNEGITHLDNIELKSRTMLFLGCGGVSSAVAVSLAPSLRRMGLIDIDASEAAFLRESVSQLEPALPVEILPSTLPRDLTAYDVIYNGTGLGKGLDKTDRLRSPLGDDEPTQAVLFIDAIYAPTITTFLGQGIRRGSHGLNGLSHMLASTAFHCSIIAGRSINASSVATVYKAIMDR